MELADQALLAMLGDMPADSPKPATTKPTLKFERAALKRGATIVAGVDEAGRGPLAGPVVVSAVVLNHKKVPAGLNDSKVLTADEREALYEKIMASAIVSIAVMPPAVIARMNILQASLWGMRQAVLGLTVKVDHLLVDGNLVPKQLPCFGQAIVGGDGKSVSIAAASIVAKVTRDRMCGIMDCEEPHFGFASHKGYAAPQHLQALSAHGPGRHHRMDFAPCIEAQRLREAGSRGDRRGGVGAPVRPTDPLCHSREGGNPVPRAPLRLWPLDPRLRGDDAGG